MGIWSAVIMGIFLYTGARFLLPTLITGTSDAEVLSLNIIPVVIAAVVIGIVWRVFKGG